MLAWKKIMLKINICCVNGYFFHKAYGFIDVPTYTYVDNIYV